MKKELVIYRNYQYDGNIYAKCMVKDATSIQYELLKNGIPIQRLTTERSFVYFEDMEGGAEYQIIATLESSIRSTQTLSSNHLTVPFITSAFHPKPQNGQMKGGNRLYDNATKYTLDILFKPNGLDTLLSDDLSQLPLYTTLKDSLSFIKTYGTNVTSHKAFSRFDHLYQIAHSMTNPQQLVMLATELETLDYVIYCSVTPRKLTRSNFEPAPSLRDEISPDDPTPDFTPLQGHLNVGHGMNVRDAWQSSTGEWVQTHHADLEYDNPHEDLMDVNYQTTDYDSGDHGTACLGCIAASNNGLGVTGVAFGSDCYAYSAMNIEHIIDFAFPGDMASVSIALNSSGIDIPVTASSFYWDTIRALTEFGVIVVPSAGNSGIDLSDTPVMVDYGDAGEILAGACSSRDGTRLSFSNYNYPTLLVNSWGQHVTTTGQGDLQFEEGTTSRDYTRYFGGTSAAAPLSSAAMALIQSYAIDTYGVFFDAWMMRNIINITGYKNAPEEAIGARPDVYHTLQYVDVLMQGGNVLVAPIVDNAQNNEIVVSELTEYTVQVIARVTSLIENMVITLFWTPSTAFGEFGATWTTEHTVDSVDVNNGQVVFHVPVDEHVLPYLGGSVAVYYYVDNQFSDLVSLSISRHSAENRPTYEKPTIIFEAVEGYWGPIEGGIVHYDATEVYLVATPPQQQNLPLVSVTVIWRCYNFDGELVETYTRTRETSDSFSPPIPIDTYVAPYQGCKVDATFTYVLFDGSEYAGPTTSALVSSPELTRATIDNIDGTVIYLSELGETVVAHVELLSNGVIGIEGDVVALTVQGYSYSGAVTPLPTIEKTISADDVSNGYLLMELPIDDYLIPFNNGAITLTYTIMRLGVPLKVGPMTAYAIDPPAASQAWFLTPVVYQANGDVITLETNTDGANASLDILSIITLPYPELVTDWVELTIEIQDADGNVIDIPDELSNLAPIDLDSDIMQAGFVSFSLSPMIYDVLYSNSSSSLHLIFFHRTGEINEQSIISRTTYQTSQVVNGNDVYVTGARRHGQGYFNQTGLQARQLNTGEPVSVRWRYEGSLLSSDGETFDDPSPEKILIVTAGEQTLRLNAANLTLSGAGFTLLSDDGQTMEQFGAESAVLNDATVGVWGNGGFGGSGDADDNVRSITDARSVYSNNHGTFNMATLCRSGQAVLWGDKHDSTLSYDNILSISATEKAFALRVSDKSLIVYGDTAYGGDSADVEGISDVERVFANGFAFAALRSDGSVVAWGDSQFGGDASSVADVTNIDTLSSTLYAFAALRQDGSVVAWGNALYGGETPEGLGDVVALEGSHKAFVALRSDGSVIAWGSGAFGGFVPADIASRNDIVSVTGCGVGFAAITDTGDVLTWGDHSIGATAEVEAILSYYGVVSIVGNSRAFAALCRNGSIVVWGDSERGGELPDTISRLRDVVAIYTGQDNFSALTKEGNVHTWGKDSTISLLQPARVNGSVSYLNQE